ncbi:MAG: redoxin domain-containing protein [Planctomycetes bacterium]|nr:redoxin domain-containing protein [Planctomycetota bacterium]
MNDESLPATSRWPKHAVWVGPIVTLVGALSYFLFFAQFPILRDFPVLNLPVVLLGFVLSGAGCWQMFRGRSGLLGKAFASVGLLMSLGVAGLFCFYIFFLSYQLPAVAAVPDLRSAAPEIALLDQNGEQVRLSDHLGSKVILVFYRGHW